MHRLALHIVVAMITFVAGVAFHRQVVHVADFAVNHHSVFLAEPAGAVEVLDHSFLNFVGHYVASSYS